MQGEAPHLTVYTVANRRYEPFVLPYAASVLATNANTVVEIGLEEPRRFERDNPDALELLGDRLVLSRVEFNNAPNSIRFVTEPSTRADYVYIGDIDILIVEPIAPSHLASMAKSGLPYSNIVRPGQERLTGLHFTAWDAFYPLTRIDCRSTIGLDEYYLWRIIQDRGLPLPPPELKFRPLHGFHLTLSQHPRTYGWGGVTNALYMDLYQQMRTSETWVAMLPLFDHRYRALLSIFEAMAATHHKVDLAPAPHTMPRDWF